MSQYKNKKTVLIYGDFSGGNLNFTFNLVFQPKHMKIISFNMDSSGETSAIIATLSNKIIDVSCSFIQDPLFVIQSRAIRDPASHSYWNTVTGAVVNVVNNYTNFSHNYSFDNLTFDIDKSINGIQSFYLRDHTGGVFGTATSQLTVATDCTILVEFSD